jgi:hypothetical protein
MQATKILLLAATIFCGGFASFAQTWTQTSAPSTNWNWIAISADGSKLAAVAGTSSKAGPIYTSTDMGVTWVRQTNAPPLFAFLGWQSVSSSADGNMLAASPYTSALIYTSTNAGLTWTQQNAPANFASVAISPDGKKLFACSFNNFYVSTNFGVNWTTNTVSGAPINTCAASSDGSRIVAGGISGSVYTSTNYGANWTAGPASGGWPSVVSSADGSKFAAAPIGSSFAVLTSTNSGGSWTTDMALDNLPVHHLATSPDGSKLIVVASGGAIYTSTNTGINWASNSVPLTNWISAASSADGNTLIAAIHGGGIWISQTVSLPQLNFTPTNGSFKLSWLIPSTNFVMQQSSDLATWSNVTNAPVLNLTNLQNEVILPMTNNSGFYRLKTP